MTDDTLETVDGYVEERPPETLVLVRDSGERYHEVAKDGDVACGVKIDREDLDEWTLEHAIHNWREPCQRENCEYRRKQRRDAETTEMEYDYSEYQPKTRFFGTGGHEDKAQLERAYWEYYWSIEQIAEWVGRSNSTIRYAMDDFDIPVRDAGDAGRIGRMKKNGVSLEHISQKYPHPEREKSKDNADRVNWSHIQS